MPNYIDIVNLGQIRTCSPIQNFNAKIIDYSDHKKFELCSYEYPISKHMQTFLTQELNKNYKAEVYAELDVLKKDFITEYNSSLPETVISNARSFLNKIIDEHIKIPHIAYNPDKQIGLTWEFSEYSAYLTVDDVFLRLSVIQLSNLKNRDSIQREIFSSEDIILKLKELI